MSAELFHILPNTSAIPAGPVESSVQRQVDALRRSGTVSAEHDAVVELCVTIARDVDRSQNIGRPSGRASLYKVLTEALAALPVPVAGGGTLDRILAALHGDVDEGDVDEGDVDEGDVDEGDVDEGGPSS